MQMNKISGRNHIVLLHRIEKTGRAMPILWLFENDYPKIFQPLIDYFQDHSSRGLNWQRQAARALGLFYDFSRSFEFDEEKSIRNRHAATISAFIQELQQGSIPLTGVDYTGLYWPAMSVRTVAEVARHLDLFVGYSCDGIGALKDGHPLKDLQKAFQGPPVDGASMMKFLIIAKRIHSRSFLKHLKNDATGAEKQRQLSRGMLGIERKAAGFRSIKVMPFQLAADLLRYGFERDRAASNIFEREDVTAKMIYILLLGGGLRRSEPLHMWFNDVTFPQITGITKCIPLLRHPSQALTFIEGEAVSRLSYLKQRGLLPRHMATDKSLHSGWKELAVDESSKSVEVYFIHEGLEQQFAEYYHYYLNFRRELVGLRKARGEGDHPFLFVSAGEDRASGQSLIGSPYSYSAFGKAFERALARVERRTGKLIRRGRCYGATPHATRHVYGQILTKIGAPQKAIQRAMHHRSILSQEVYTEPEWEEVCMALNAARSGEANNLLKLNRPFNDPIDKTQELKRQWRF